MIIKSVNHAKKLYCKSNKSFGIYFKMIDLITESRAKSRINLFIAVGFQFHKFLKKHDTVNKTDTWLVTILEPLENFNTREICRFRFLKEIDYEEDVFFNKQDKTELRKTHLEILKSLAEYNRSLNTNI